MAVEAEGAVESGIAEGDGAGAVWASAVAQSVESATTAARAIREPLSASFFKRMELLNRAMKQQAMPALVCVPAKRLFIKDTLVRGQSFRIATIQTHNRSTPPIHQLTRNRSVALAENSFDAAISTIEKAALESSSNEVWPFDPSGLIVTRWTRSAYVSAS
jgi:hypothetical protein